MINIPQDFNSMQSQAIKYAREMQQRAAASASPEPQRSNSNTQQAQKNPSSFHNPNEVFGHRNPWTQERETPFCKSACPIKNVLGSGGNKNSSADNDIMLLMALLLVLSQDGGDKMLMLALLYIMT